MTAGGDSALVITGYGAGLKDLVDLPMVMQVRAPTPCVSPTNAHPRRGARSMARAALKGGRVRTVADNAQRHQARGDGEQEGVGSKASCPRTLPLFGLYAVTPTRL